MEVQYSVNITLPNGSTYEYDIDTNGHEHEFLKGVGLKNGHYCKYYCKRRDWSEKRPTERDYKTGLPYEQHYCLKDSRFLGVSYCCSSCAKCFEEGKSAGVKRLLNKIRKKIGYIPAEK